MSRPLLFFTHDSFLYAAFALSTTQNGHPCTRYDMPPILPPASGVIARNPQARYPLCDELALTACSRCAARQ